MTTLTLRRRIATLEQATAPTDTGPTVIFLTTPDGDPHTALFAVPGPHDLPTSGEPRRPDEDADAFVARVQAMANAATREGAG